MKIYNSLWGGVKQGESATMYARIYSISLTKEASF